MSRGVRRTSDEGGVLVEYLLIAILVVIIALGVVQLALALHVRNMLVSAASEGARFAAAQDRELAEGRVRTELLIRESLGDYPARVDATSVVLDGVDMVVMRVEAPLPVFGLWGMRNVAVDAHALEEVHRG